MLIHDQHAALDELGQGERDLSQPAAAEHDPGEAVVDVGGTLQAQRLLVEDHAQDRLMMSLKLLSGGSSISGEPMASAAVSIAGRDLLEVSVRLEWRSREALGVQLGYQRPERGAVVAQG